MSKYVLQISSSVKYIALGKTASCFMAILLDQLILRYRPLKYFSPGSITWPHLSDNLDSATPFSVIWTKYKGSTWLPVNNVTKEGASANSKTCCSQTPSAFSPSSTSKWSKSSLISSSKFEQFWNSNKRHDLQGQRYSFDNENFLIQILKDVASYSLEWLKIYVLEAL